ncbi:MAG: outer membrane lipoprotein-sorting protein [Aquabacterium sp.]|nr:outer membrane lipoprotein-sorting protein [Aquabacterium sp.]
MHHFITSCLRPLLVIAVSLVVVPASASDEGLRLVQAVYERPAGRDTTVVSRMELTARSGAPRVRELVTYRQERARGEYQSLARFLAPEDISGTGLLSVDKADGSAEQWLYLPAMDRVRRVASDRKGGRFVASDIYFEDLQTRKPTSDRHRLIGRESIDGTACEVVESVPVEASNSVYKRRLLWIDPQLALVLRVDFFEKDEAVPSKRWQMLTKQRIQGYWTVTESKTTDLASGHETRMVALSVKYDRRLPAKLFSTQALSDEAIESSYRP